MSRWLKIKIIKPTPSMSKICPSILCADMLHLGDDINLLRAEGINLLHIDIMDGHFVPRIELGRQFLRACSTTGMTMDVHLMVDNPREQIEKMSPFADILTFHYEATSGTDECIELAKLIKSLGKKAGIAIKPKTDISVLEPLLEHFNHFLVMSVEPGMSGQNFILETLGKLKDLNEMLGKRKEGNLIVQIDGGINASTLPLVADFVDLAVVGSALFNKSGEDRKSFLHELGAIFNNANR